MISIVMSFDLVVAAGIAILAARYSFGPAPTSYHRQILEVAGHSIDEPMTRLFRGLNRVLGGSLFAIAAAIALTSITGVSQDRPWAESTVLVVALLVGLPATFAAIQLEKRSQVRTPWRPAAALTALAVIGFIVSLFA